MSLLNRLFGKSDASSELLCPHCERAMEAGHDVERCARKRLSRRHFLGALGGAAAALAVKPVVKPRGLFNPAADIGGQWKAGKLGISMRWITQYDVGAGLLVSRMDVLHGLTPLPAETDCCILG